MKLSAVWAAAGFVPLLLVAPARASEPLDLFNSEAAALNHCGDDTVVWLDVPANTYSLKGQHGYGGASRDGGYTCRRDAIHSGNHARRD
jgi:hypothetical protein